MWRVANGLDNAALKGKVVKVENFNVETLLGHGVLRSKCKLELKVDSFCKGVLRSKIKL